MDEISLDSLMYSSAKYRSSVDAAMNDNVVLKEKENNEILDYCFAYMNFDDEGDHVFDDIESTLGRIEAMCSIIFPVFYSLYGPNR